MECLLEIGVPLVFLKGLRQNGRGEVSGEWKEAGDADVQ
jgi:hypothetical protein